MYISLSGKTHAILAILFMVALWALYFRPVVSIFLSSFFFSSPNLSGGRLDVYHILPHLVWPWCEFRMHVWNVLHAARWKYRTRPVFSAGEGSCMGPHLTHCRLGRGLPLHTKCHIDPFSHLTTTNEPKIGAMPPFWGDLGPHLTQCGLDRGLPPYQVASWFIQPFVHTIDTCRKSAKWLHGSRCHLVWS